MSADRLLFKYYDKKVEKMSGIFTIEDLADIGPTHRDWLGEDLKPDEIIWLQCTGLKDKNGTLIFENDLLSNDAVEYPIQISWNKTGGLFYLWYNIPDCSIPMILNTEYTCSTSEIIGNIHQQPHLIGGDNS